MAAGATQENMLRDEVRVNSYHTAIRGNPADFRGKTVMDVGAGTGLLSFFSAQAGAAKVYSVEVSKMAEVERTLVKANHFPNTSIEVVNLALEKITTEVPGKVDAMVSEPLGVLLFHERMIESYLLARDRFLRPGGKMFPNGGVLAVQPFADQQMFEDFKGSAPEEEAATEEVSFWRNDNFYGINLTAAEAFVPKQEATPVSELTPIILDSAKTDGLLAEASTLRFDFESVPVKDLQHITVPLSFTVAEEGPVHGVVGWFDAIFQGSDAAVVLSTSPNCPTTHWWQTYMLLKEPLMVAAGEHVEGTLVMEAEEEHNSYIVNLTMRVKETGISTGTQTYSLWNWVYRPDTETSNWATHGSPEAAPGDDCHSGELLPAGFYSS